VTEPRGPARDSSLQDRKAPENCLLRTVQPRTGNVVHSDSRRHLSRSAIPLSPLWGGEGWGEGASPLGSESCRRPSPASFARGLSRRRERDSTRRDPGADGASCYSRHLDSQKECTSVKPGGGRMLFQ